MKSNENNKEKRLNYRLKKRKKKNESRKRILSLFKTIFSAITCLNSRSNELKSFENQSNSIPSVPHRGGKKNSYSRGIHVVDETCRAAVCTCIYAERGGMGFGEAGAVAGEGEGGWDNADRRTAYPVGRNRSTAAALTG